ncbi:hypothetical protein [Roseibium sediminicola]|uniref:Uncharacterized protein n=1 Tax=Roseibium sediminicola TaxID=2933272 RepID=A0ABT0H0G7_9HYPH|nr:hypothetical protein [Roseibium sp. CAU 1639]MCK7615189.1 hypothetical protein [Roseibium sp. CAU 1639]
MSKTGNALAHLQGKPAPATASDDTAADGEDEDDEEEMSDDTSSEDEDTDDEAEGGGDESEDEASEQASNVAAGFALMRSPEAKGRTKLATELAEDVASGRMSVDRAKTILKTGAKESSLSAAMNGKDKSPGQDAPNASAGNFKGKDASLVSMANKAKAARSGR